MKPIEAHLEYLYHFHCSSCKRWWTIADIAPRRSSEQSTFVVFCPHCGAQHKVGAIVAHADATEIDRVEPRG
jgi:RNase P subunit RPR2